MAHKIKTIKRLHQLPTPHAVLALEEVNRQTPRGAAIAGTAYLDLLLRWALEKQMRPSSQIREKLFENRGSLQDFSARINIAFAFWIIGTGAHHDLSILRDIRNAFAHSAESFDFERDDIASRCRTLWYPTKIQYKNRSAPITPRELFVRAIELLADGLCELARFNDGELPRVNTLIHMRPKASQNRKAS